MDKKEIMQGMYDAILSLDKAKALDMANSVLSENMDINEVIEQFMSPAMEEVGNRFQSGDMFLPELQMSADVFSSAMDLLQPKLMEGKAGRKSKGKVVIGTVKGDLHCIGKDLVATMLKIGGFEVTDLGVDVPTLTFLEQAEKEKVDIIALSALLTTTMPAQREVIEALTEQGMRERFKVLIGGAPVDTEWAEKIGADAYGENAAEAVKLAARLCSPGAIY